MTVYLSQEVRRDAKPNGDNKMKTFTIKFTTAKIRELKTKPIVVRMKAECLQDVADAIYANEKWKSAMIVEASEK